jgi:hypothetical protein
MDAVKLGLLCITAISIAITVTAIVCKVDKAYEICLGALAAVTVIGGWLGHSPSAGKDPGSGTSTDKPVAPVTP